MSRKFLEALDDVLTSPKTNPVVKERIMEVLGAAAHSQREYSCSLLVWLA
jgi:hypothetical protein